MSEGVLFLDFCSAMEAVSQTKSRIEKQKITAELFRKVIECDKNALVAVLFLSSATIEEQYLNIELGVGESAIMSVVSESTGLSVKNIKHQLVKTGDLAVIAMENRVKQLFVSDKQLTITEVLKELREIALVSGKDSLKLKKNKMLKLINYSSVLETKYLIRLFETKLKVGLALQTILIALGHAFHKEEKTDLTADDYSNIVKEAYSKRPDFKGLIEHIFEHGVESLPGTYMVHPGTPLRPMLAKPCKNLTSAFSKLESDGFVAEYKYDGERVQLHNIDGKIKIFSRNTEDLTQKYPDIAGLALNSKSFILDCEAVAYSEGKILPFQVLSTRKRKHTGTIDVHICIFAFDLLFFDSTELLNLPLKERRKILFEKFKEIKNKFHFATGMVCESCEDMELLFKEAVSSSCEGVMLKSLSSPYKPSHRTNKWIKIKNDYLENIGDSLDLVVMGAYYGKGKRTGTYGGFLLGTYNPETGMYETCCKLGTGFSDELLGDLFNKMSALVTTDTSEYSFSNKNIVPDVWVRPSCVWEVKAASISHSPVYVAGLSDGRGLSLRFPRFIREREDKKPEDATTSQQLVKIYNEDLNEDSEDVFN